MNAVALACEGVTRRLAGPVPVALVRDAGLRVRRGEFVAITGPSGSGKSSLLYLLGLLDRPSAGRIWLDGQETTGLDDDALAALRLTSVGFVFQFHFLLPEFTALENVLLPMRRLGRLDPDAIAARGRALLAQLGLGAEADKLPAQLSGGQSQRVAIARALANDPAVILADEPTGNLDSAASANVRAILQDLAHRLDRAVVVVTHDRDFAAAADRVVMVVDGRVTAA
jgi:lipoprotein-releasing system ATP-binding protein